MGTKGDRDSGRAGPAAEDFASRVAGVGEVTTKRMFGGVGVFQRGRMFALVDSRGDVHLKVGDSNRDFADLDGAERHGRMPYYRVPPDVLADDDDTIRWAAEAASEAHRSK